MPVTVDICAHLLDELRDLLMSWRLMPRIGYDYRPGAKRTSTTVDIVDRKAMQL
jgi:hypothetical protein